MKQTFLQNLKEDILIPLGGRYFLKRYAYWKDGEGCWVDDNRKVITERMFTFIIMHGKTWDNSTNLNFRESKLDTVMETYEGVLAKVKAERKALLTAERAERKLYPRLTQYQFNNVLISVVEQMKYYDKYPGIGEKEIAIYANGMPFSYRTRLTFPKDFEVTKHWTLDMVANSYVLQYNHNDISDWFKTGSFVFKSLETSNHAFVPYHFYIGYQIEYKGTRWTVYDACDSGFEDSYGKVFPVPIEDLHNVNVIGQLQGLEALIPLRNKLQYVR